MFLSTSVIKNNSEVVADGPISDTYHAANQYGPRRQKYFSRDHHMVIREASESLLFQAKGSNSEYYVTDKVYMSEVSVNFTTTSFVTIGKTASINTLQAFVECLYLLLNNAIKSIQKYAHFL